MTDLVALHAVRNHPGVVMATAELAVALGVTEDEAAARIAKLTTDGYLTGPMQVRSTSGAWSEIGFKLTVNASDLLEAE